ncbi:hypothetical protein EYZ11_001204 [Aspergillus tanneri]|uniref:Uncharacterized protein n=1 Tax=Aspergillus tanneri TaxID=1220188 RepID=A0A4S3JV51_9EURO|nr:hypothetical protein EYZ11_001204 [Aspergillus tanneri]
MGDNSNFHPTTTDDDEPLYLVASFLGTYGA